jgi:GNAT superfamily N-acetyltransferase
MTPDTLFSVAEATWPPHATQVVGPWLIRDGRGGGQRVSATSAVGPWGEGDIARAEDAMRALGQAPLFVIRDGEAALDAALAARGYGLHDPVVAYAAPVAELASVAPPFLTSFPHWPPLSVARQIWEEGGIGPARVAVMERVAGHKTCILGRTGDRAAGAAFVAVHGNVAMLHALDVSPALRRTGCGHNILRAAAGWARDHGAETLALLVTERNLAARGLYAFLNMQVVGQYHYRKS